MTNLVHKKPAPALQWLRKVSLVMGQIGGKSLDLSEFRFTFSVKRGDTRGESKTTRATPFAVQRCLVQRASSHAATPSLTHWCVRGFQRG